jgi:ATP-binding cassette subfamily F protein 3
VPAIRNILGGFLFSGDDVHKKAGVLSGGERTRLAVARMLLRPSNTLLLDEPTNHLDLDAVLWVQDWLKSYPGTLLCISHDREFLDAITTHTLHLHSGTCSLYTGNYSQFERQRAERLALQSSAYEKQQREIAHLQGFINRFKAKASKATQAQSRVKQLERMQLVAAVHADSEFSFEFPEPHRLPSPLIRFDDVSAGYASRTILSKLKLLIAPGERIGLLGPNGAGKSTLVRTLAGELPALGGNAMRDPYLRVGYFAQHQVEQLDPKASPIVHFRRINPKATEQELRSFLGGFNFRGDRVFEAVEPFSGGEKARLALAMVVYQRPNLLLLDEPTNHLDLDMRHALEEALLGYAGAVVLVSHDRHLLSATCEDLWLVAGGACAPFDGDLDDYARWLSAREKGEPRAEKSGASVSARDRRKAAADERALRAAVGKLDAQLSKLHAQLAQIDERLADPAIYAGDKTAERSTLQKEQAKLRQRIAAAEEEWLKAADELEALGA